MKRQRGWRWPLRAAGLRLAVGITASLAVSCAAAQSVRPAKPPRSGVFAETALAVGLGAGTRALGRRVTGVPVVATGDIGYERVVAPGWSARVSVGGARAWRRGRVGEARYRVRAWRISAGAQAGRRVSPRGDMIYAGAEVRNGRPLADFDSRADGNVRVRLRLDYVRALSAHWDLTATLATPLRESADVRVLADAGVLLGAGLRYRFRASSPR